MSITGLSADALWQSFADLTRTMFNLAVEGEWENVARLAVKRLELEKQLESVSQLDIPEDRIVELIKTASEQNQKIAYLAKRYQTNCQGQMKNLAKGKKAAAAYTP